MRGDHGRAGVGGGLDVRQLQDSLSQHRMFGAGQLPDGLHHFAHGVDRVDALVRVGGVGGCAEGLYHDLRPAPLANLEIAQGCLSNHHVVRMDGLTDAPGGHALKALLVHGACDVDLSAEVAVPVLAEKAGGGSKGGHGALHI